MNYGCSILIVVQSFMARFGFIQLTRLIHFTSVSQRMTVITISVFCIFFTNYGLMYLIAPLQMNLGVLSKMMI